VDSVQCGRHGGRTGLQCGVDDGCQVGRVVGGDVGGDGPVASAFAYCSGSTSPPISRFVVGTPGEVGKGSTTVTWGEFSSYSLFIAREAPLFMCRIWM